MKTPDPAPNEVDDDLADRAPDPTDDAPVVAPPSLWARRDTIVLTLVTLVAGILRVARLDLPKKIVFDETYYAKDACWFVNVSEKICQIGYEQTNVHPPLGKWLIAIGIRLFGYDSFGWRISAAVAGTVTVALLYLLARRVLRSTLGAVIASGLLAIDLLHFVQSRISMLDIFVPLFGIAALLFLVYDRDRFRGPPDMRGANGLLDRPWRLAAGACAGAAVACKWTGIFYLVLVIVLTIFWEISERRVDDAPHPIARFLRQESLTIFFWLIVLPVVVYAFTYIGRLEGGFLASPTSPDSFWRQLWERQVFMYDFHTTLESSHGYQSNPETWLLLKRPVSYHIEYGPRGEYGEVMATGSPFVWWASILAIVYVAFRWIGGRLRRIPQGGRHWRPEGVILAGFVFTYVPWLIAPGSRAATFIFYLLPTVPFMCLALAYVATEIGRSWEAKAAIALFAAGAIGFFVFYYPVVASVQIPKKQWDRRIWEFDHCDKPEGTPTKSTITNTIGKRTRTTVVNTRSNAELPPLGWCWI